MARITPLLLPPPLPNLAGEEPLSLDQAQGLDEFDTPVLKETEASRGWRKSNGRTTYRSVWLTYVDKRAEKTKRTRN